MRREWAVWGRRIVMALLVSGISACALIPKRSAPKEELISGRLSVRVEADGGTPKRNLSGSFELRGSPSAGQFDLTNPLGMILAQARWSAQQVLLKTPEGKRLYPDLDTLTQHMLGGAIPVAALFDWLRGRPWPGAISQSNTPPAEAGFEQLGWRVSLVRFDDGWITAHRIQPPEVTVRAIVESR